jgi:hypothetical protein
MSDDESTVIVEETHPLWKAWDDDDWNAATATAWMNRHIRPGIHVVLKPPADARPTLAAEVAAAMKRFGATVEP